MAWSGWVGTAVAVVLLALGGSPALATPRVELVTIDPGDEVWTRFGHVALRVVDEATGRDDLYSYGFAPFDRPDFLWGYLRGESEFYLASRTWRWSMRRYIQQDRTVRRRPLALDAAATAELVARLEANALPENRGYRYRHLDDNCSTRVRDLLDSITGGALRRAADTRQPRATYRDYTLLAGSGRTLVQIGFDLIGGPTQERPVNGWAQLYLPVYLEEAATEALVPGPGGGLVPLAGPAQEPYRRRGPPSMTGNRWTGRLWLLGSGAGLGLLLAASGWRRRRAAPPRRRLWTRLYGLLLLPSALLLGLLGLVLLALVAVSRVPDFAWNENVLVLLPTDLAGVGVAVGALLGRGDRPRRLWRGYLWVRLGLLGLYAVAKLLGAFPQDNWVFVAAVGVVAAGWLEGARGEGVNGRRG